MALVSTQRTVIILEIEFQQCRLDAGAVLQAHGIVPYLPYTREPIDVLGAPGHRFTQPPRPAKPLLREKDTD